MGLSLTSLILIGGTIVLIVMIIVWTRPTHMKKYVKCSECGTRFKVEPNQIHASYGQPSGVGDDGADYWIFCPKCGESNPPY